MHDLEDAVLPSLSQMFWGTSTCSLDAIPRVHYEQMHARRTSRPGLVPGLAGHCPLPSVDFGVRLTQWRCEAVSHPGPGGTRDTGWIGGLRIGSVVLRHLACVTRPTHMNRDYLWGGLFRSGP